MSRVDRINRLTNFLRSSTVPQPDRVDYAKRMVAKGSVAELVVLLSSIENGTVVHTESQLPVYSKCNCTTGHFDCRECFTDWKTQTKESKNVRIRSPLLMVIQCLETATQNGTIDDRDISKSLNFIQSSHVMDEELHSCFIYTNDDRSTAVLIDIPQRAKNTLSEKAAEVVKCLINERRRRNIKVNKKVVQRSLFKLESL